MSNETVPSGDSLYHLQKQFLSCVPSKALPFSKLFSIKPRPSPDPDDASDTSVSVTSLQDALLNVTVNDDLVKKYPIKIEYQRSYLKTFISWLEQIGLEISENLYTTYCELLSAVNKDDSTHFKHYLLDQAERIVLKESSRVISHGTTGLCSWQASQALAEWCLLHQDFLRNKRVLELGSGTGLTGLAASLKCQPKSYWFSDCHPAVLDLLRTNITLNSEHHKQLDELDEDTASKVEDNVELDSCKVLLSCVVKETDIKVLYLPWEEVNDTSIAPEVSPSVILAADVVYDDGIFKDLISALKFFLLSRQPSECVVIMACTIRNPATFQQFLNLLRAEIQGVQILEEDPVKPNIFIFSTDTKIQILKISIPLP